MKRWFPLATAFLWAAAVSAGLGVLLAHEHAPGPAMCVPLHWPLFSKIPRDSNLPTLIMFAHPYCPCTRASVGELAILMAHCGRRVNACVLFIGPAETPDFWMHTDLWRSAEMIPGVTVRLDSAGSEAKRFGANTSGDVLLYDKEGRLLFDGGITASRGHSGDNSGRVAVMDLVNHLITSAAITPVFGCPLFNPKEPVCGTR